MADFGGLQKRHIKQIKTKGEFDAALRNETLMNKGLRQQKKNSFYGHVLISEKRDLDE